MLERWESHGYDVDLRDATSDGLPRATITMPDGIRLVLESAPELSSATEMDHVHLYSTDPDALSQWYANVLGASSRVGGDTPRVEVPGGEVRFGRTDRARAASDGTAIDHIGFEVSDIETFSERLDELGIAFESGPFYVESLDLWVGFFTDPHGVLVEATQGLASY